MDKSFFLEELHIEKDWEQEKEQEKEQNSLNDYVDLGKKNLNNENEIHHFIESLKLTFADREMYFTG